jgi:hypothetical protein
LEKANTIFSFINLWVDVKATWGWMYHLRDGGENKMSKDEFTHPSTTKLG